MQKQDSFQFCAAQLSRKNKKVMVSQYFLPLEVSLMAFYWLEVVEKYNRLRSDGQPFFFANSIVPLFATQ